MMVIFKHDILGTYIRYVDRMSVQEVENTMMVFKSCGYKEDTTRMYK